MLYLSELWKFEEYGVSRYSLMVAKALVCIGIGYWARSKGYRFSTFFLVSFVLDPLVCAAALIAVPKVQEKSGYYAAPIKESAAGKPEA